MMAARRSRPARPLLGVTAADVASGDVPSVGTASAGGGWVISGTSGTSDFKQLGLFGLQKIVDLLQYRGRLSGDIACRLIGHLPGVIVGALLLSALPEVLRYVAGPLQAMTDGRLDASILRQLLIALAMIGIMLSRPRGLWPSPEHGRGSTATTPELPAATHAHLEPAEQIPPQVTPIVPGE